MTHAPGASPSPNEPDAWIAGDPDPAARAELRGLAPEDLAARFAAPLTFGTAGLRGPLRAGPSGMNEAVVVRATAGLAAHLRARGEQGATVVLGRDARRGSEAFARAAAEVLAAAGFDVLAFDDPLPTPVTAFAVRDLDAAAGIQITASHNPPGDNGYKVYLRGGAQIVPPADDAIAAEIRRVGPAVDVPRQAPVAAGDPRGPALVERYKQRTAAILDGAGPTAAEAGAEPPPLRVALTPMHGVGGDIAVEVLRRAGVTDVHVVDEQFAPDPDFPTVAFPNPEEPGAADRLLALAERIEADVAIALDPDADRCALGVDDPRDGWRMLRGDETGPLLAERILGGRTLGGRILGRTGAQPDGARPLVATTIVSSTLLGRIAHARGALQRTTLTGFKWLVRAADGVDGARLVYAYEEAIGLCVDPDAVRDKDGISAAVALCRMAADLKNHGGTVPSELDRLAREFGVHAGTQISVRAEGTDGIAARMRRLRAQPPAALAGTPVTCRDLAEREDVLRTDAVLLRGDRSGAEVRLVVRPSGTEPKLKAYLEVALAPGGPGELESDRERAASLLSDAAAEVRRLLDA